MNYNGIFSRWGRKRFRLPSTWILHKIIIRNCTILYMYMYKYKRRIFCTNLWENICKSKMQQLFLKCNMSLYTERTVTMYFVVSSYVKQLFTFDGNSIQIQDATLEHSQNFGRKYCQHVFHSWSLAGLNFSLLRSNDSLASIVEKDIAK